METNGAGNFTEEVFHWKKASKRKREMGVRWRAKRGPTIRPRVSPPRLLFIRLPYHGKTCALIFTLFSDMAARR
jgi:hypothetical protein